MPDDDRSAAQLQRQASSFGAAADAYERGRPPYPPEAIGWLLPEGVSRVLDLGAGTGKLTRQLRGRGLDVVAVEPSAGMREQLARAVPDVTVLAGTAEDIPLPDGSVDAVLVAQAWHWVDPGRSSRAGSSAWCGTSATSGRTGWPSWAGSCTTRTNTAARTAGSSGLLSGRLNAVTWNGGTG
jgi:SAM-dependent methyltransferase